VIGLEQMELETPELSAMARQDLHKVAGIATEVSSDIHNLSHELHPSKLDSLCLVVALDSFLPRIFKAARPEGQVYSRSDSRSNCQ